MNNEKLNYDNREFVLNTIGVYCAITRLRKGITQKMIASELKCSPQNISLFEHGKVDSGIILFWYVKHGLLDILELWGEIAHG